MWGFLEVDPVAWVILIDPFDKILVQTQQLAPNSRRGYKHLEERLDFQMPVDKTKKLTWRVRHSHQRHSVGLQLPW